MSIIPCNSQSWRVVSAIPGRVRIQWTHPRTGPSIRRRLLEEIAARLSAVAGSEETRIAHDARSIILRYAARERALAEVLTDITAIAAEVEAEIKQWKQGKANNATSALSAVHEYTGISPTEPIRAEMILHPSHHASPANTTRRIRNALLSTAAVVAAATEAAPVALTGVLLALASYPLVRRSIRGMRNRRLSMDQMDFVNLILLAWIGDFVAAGQINLIISLSDLWGSRRLRHIRHKIYELLLRESIGRDTASCEVVQMIEKSFIANAHIEHEISAEGDRLVAPLLGAAGATYLMTDDPLRMISVLKFSDLASDVRIAAPTTVLSAITAGARHGMVFHSARAMEKLAQVDAVVLDRQAEAVVDAESREAERASIAAATEALLERGVRRILLQPGRAALAARAIAKKSGLPDGIIEVTASQYASAVQHLREEGYRLAILGDGSEGSPFYTRADVGVIITHRAVTADQMADLFLLDGDLRSLARAIDCARKTMDILNQNKRLVVAPTTAGLIGSILGLTTPVIVTLLNYGTGAIAGLNALRPLLQQGYLHPPTPTHNGSSGDRKP